MKKCFFSLLLAAIIFVPFTTNAQVTIGSGRAPSEWSLLDLCTDYQRKALHNARMTTEQRNALVTPDSSYIVRREARGLMIFNISDNKNCLEFWSGSQWVSLCVGDELWLRVTPRFHMFPSEGDEYTFVVDTSASSWSVAWVGTHTGFTYYIPNPNPDNEIIITAEDNTGGSRQGILRVTAGGMTKDVVVKQMQGGPPGLTGTISGSFVGAFWRHGQMGERLIRMPHDADQAWTATAMDDWILLCSQPSTATGLGTRDFESPELPQHHLNPDSSTVGSSVSGRGEIRFRIGLDGTIDEDEHRWGRVVVLHNDNSLVHIIWIRQGEAAHYVMTPNCPGGNRNENNARRWSAFNIRPSQNFSSVWEFFTHRGGIPTRYPTQAGALFQWAGQGPAFNNWSLRGFCPSTAIGGPNLNWQNTIIRTNDSWWDSLRNPNEVCPIGYRRPGGITNAFTSIPASVPNCEFSQSFFANVYVVGPGSGSHVASRTNSVGGAYADGFFDRRIPQDGAIPNSIDFRSNTAHAGALIFNPVTNYHLFLPASGHRLQSSGNLAFFGNLGTFWSTKSSWGGNVDGARSGVLHISPGGVHYFLLHSVHPSTHRSHGHSIRCVRE